MRRKTRKRILAFRIGESDYEKIKAVSDIRGNCLSEVAREAVLRFAREAEPAGSVDGRLTAIDQKLDQVLGIIKR